MAEMELEGAEGNGLFRTPWKYHCGVRMRFLILKRKRRCQEIITTQADRKMLKLNWPFLTTGIEQLKMLPKDIA
ncbi:hypothetical protein CEXT_104091 [Caerostris extrusa]|uniref:Uncharacterized protein n=1 Tax=Caerostris extrusa TaxID=172846 RepID=A0AAV4N6H7_CAEEX|nr:hypothetical protein CEXT_104091 [Caerostris extrusa]